MREKKDFRKVIFKKILENLILFLFFLIGVFLRFYRLEEFTTFLADQGRDAIIIKRILTLEHLPAIGPPTSVGQVYLGPFYYYFIAPWLLLFNFNPVGLAFGVAFFSSLFILINYFIVRELFDEKTALISSFLITFSSVLIDFSRFSWNPNLLPLFTLLTIYFLIKALKTQKKIFYFLFGSFLSFCLQLHYLALFLILPIIITSIIRLIEVGKDERKSIVLNYFLSLISFSFFSSPLLIFDLRHNFLNSKNFLALFKASNEVVSNKVTNLLVTFEALNKYVFNFQMSRFFSIVLLMLFFIAGILFFKKKDNLRIFFIFFIFMLGGISLYNGPKYPHYLGILYPVYFLLLSHLINFFLVNFLGKIILVTFLLSFLALNTNKYYFIFQKGNNQIDKAEKISKVIYNNLSSNKFTLTSLPYRYSDTHYRYFLEIWGKKPVEKDSLEKTDELFIVCEEECQPIGDPQWDIAYFAPKKIVETWKIDNIKIYKLVH